MRFAYFVSIHFFLLVFRTILRIFWKNPLFLDILF